MNKKFIIGILCCIIVLPACNVTQRTAAVYPIVDDVVTNGCLRTDLEIGGRVEGTFSGHVLPISGKITGKQKAYLVAQRESISLTHRGIRAARIKDPFLKAKQAALHEAIKNTKYDMVLNPIYTIKKEGLKITITARGFGAIVKTIRQEDCLGLDSEHTWNLYAEDGSMLGQDVPEENAAAIEKVLEEKVEHPQKVEESSVVKEEAELSPEEKHQKIVQQYKANKKTGNVVYKSYMIVYKNLSAKSNKKTQKSLAKVQEVVMNYLAKPKQYRNLVSELKQATSDAKKLKAFLKA